MNIQSFKVSQFSQFPATLGEHMHLASFPHNGICSFSMKNPDIYLMLPSFLQTLIWLNHHIWPHSSTIVPFVGSLFTSSLKNPSKKSVFLIGHMTSTRINHKKYESQKTDSTNTLPETNSSHLKMDSWNTTCSFLLGPGLFSGAFAVSFRECKCCLFHHGFSNGSPTLSITWFKSTVLQLHLLLHTMQFFLPVEPWVKRGVVIILQG